jgi:hypothetical protein
MVAKLLGPLLSRIVPLRRAKACDPFDPAVCNQCNYQCGTCLGGGFTNYGCCTWTCFCC